MKAACVRGGQDPQKFSRPHLCVQSTLQLVQLHSPVHRHHLRHPCAQYTGHGACSESSTGLGETLASTSISKQEDPSPEKDPGVLLEIRGFLTLAWGPFLHSSGIHTKRKLIICLTSRKKEVSDQPKHSESSKASNRKTQAGWMKGSCQAAPVLGDMRFFISFYNYKVWQVCQRPFRMFSFSFS